MLNMVEVLDSGALSLKRNIIIPIIATENDQITMYGIVQDANPENLNTLELPPTHNEELSPIHEEEQQQPQLEVSLRRSTRKRRMMIPNDYIVYLQEHEFGMGLEDDPISFSQAKQSVNSYKLIEAMKDEMKSMKDNDVQDLIKLPE